MRALANTEIETPLTTAPSPQLRGGDLAAGAATSQLLLLGTTRVPPWREQLTLRGVAVAAALGSLLCVVIHRLNLTVGVIPALNVASGLLSYFLTTAWRASAGRLGFGRGSPFTRQENTVIQTCAIACAGLAFSGCSASYIFAMDRKTYELVGPDYPPFYPGNRVEDVKDPSLGWMIGFLFLIALLGPFAIVILRKVLVIDYKLAFPGGTATALMINSLHGEKEADLTGKKVHCMVKYMGLSFGWSFFKWFFSGVGDSCGFDNFPTFGPEAFKNTTGLGKMTSCSTGPPQAAHPLGSRRVRRTGIAAVRGDPPLQPHRRGHPGPQHRLFPPRLLPHHSVVGGRWEARVRPWEAGSPFTRQENTVMASSRPVPSCALASRSAMMRTLEASNQDILQRLYTHIVCCIWLHCTCSNSTLARFSVWTWDVNLVGVAEGEQMDPTFIHSRSRPWVCAVE